MRAFALRTNYIGPGLRQVPRNARCYIAGHRDGLLVIVVGATGVTLVGKPIDFTTPTPTSTRAIKPDTVKRATSPFLLFGNVKEGNRWYRENILQTETAEAPV